MNHTTKLIGSHFDLTRPWPASVISIIIFGYHFDLKLALNRRPIVVISVIQKSRVTAAILAQASFGQAWTANGTSKIRTHLHTNNGQI